MEPIRNTKTARLRRLKMYREDLDGFIALFQNACSSVTISDGSNRYESLEEMKAYIGSTIQKLDIRGEKPNIHFLLNRQEHLPGYSTPSVFNELRTEEATDEADMLFFKAKEYLGEREQSSVRVPMLILGVLSIVGIFWFGLNNVMVTAQGQQKIRLTLGFVISFITLGIGVVRGLNVQNNLTLERKINAQSFWKRNQETFATHAVTSAISGLVGYILGHFLK